MPTGRHTHQNMFQQDNPPSDTIHLNDQLNLQHYDLTRLNCSGLSLQRSGFDRLNADLLPRIRYLNLTENFIHGHGLISSPFVNLEVLVLDRNIITSLSNNVSEVFPSLKSLYVSQNKIVNTGFLRRFAHVTKVNLNENLIKTLDSLPPNIEHLSARRNDIQLIQSRLPEGMISLDLRKNNLKYAGLPFNWGSSLRSLNLSFNRIQRFPRKLPDTLEHLDLEGNLLEELPKTLPLSLKFLNVADNKIRVLPEYPENKIDMLVISNNKLVNTVPQTNNWVKVLIADENWDRFIHYEAQKTIRNAWKRALLWIRLRTIYRCRILYYELMMVSMQPGRFYQVL